MRSLHTVGAASAVALFLLLGLPGPAVGAAPDAVAYWWRLQASSAPHVEPPHVPEGGLWVAADPTGEQAVSALRATAREGTTVGAMTLNVADATGTIEVVACPATTPWEPAEAGAWDERPSVACDTFAVEGVVAEDGTSVAFDFGALGVSAIDVVIGARSEASTFSATFDPVDDATVALVPRPAAPTAGPVPSAAATETPVTGDISAHTVDPPVAPAAAPDVTSYTPPVVGFAAPTYDGVTTGRPTEQAVQGGPALASLPRPQGARQPLGLLAAALVIGAWWWRMRAAVRSAGAHPLAADFAARPAAETAG